MLKKIALAAIFAVASIVSLSSTPVSAAKPAQSGVHTTVGAPVMQGFCHAMGRC